MTTLPSTKLIIDVLGGNQKVAAITGSTPGAVSNWRKTKLPAASYVVLQTKLKKMGFSAPDYLWAMRKVGKSKKKRAAR